MQVQVRDLAKHIAHRHIECAPFLKRKTAQVIKKIVFERQTVTSSLFEKLFAAETKRVTWFPGNVGKKLAKACGVLLLFFQTDVAIYRAEATQFFRAHCVIAFPRRA